MNLPRAYFVFSQSELPTWRLFDEAHGRLAQLVRASALQAEGRWFESSSVHIYGVHISGVHIYFWFPYFWPTSNNCDKKYLGLSVTLSS